MDTYKKWEDVPDNLATKSQLNKIGMRVSKGQLPVAQKIGGYGTYDLYDINDALLKRPPTPAQMAAIEKAKAQALLNSRCAICKDPFKYSGSRRIKTNGPADNGAYICQFCRDKRAAARWAANFLKDPNNLILDTETTGLDNAAQIVEIAIINTLGETVFNSLVKPTIPIPPDVTAIHGITNEEAATAPTWTEIDAQIFSILMTAPTITIYNAAYDLRLIWQTRTTAHNLPPAPVIYWDDYGDGMDRPQLKIRCAMERYAKWFGEWSSYYNSYKWQRLNGGHRALGDCLAVLGLLKEMAASND